MYSYDFEIDVFRCIRAMFKRKGFIALITSLFLVAGIGLTLEKGVDKYTSVATVYAAADNNGFNAADAVTAMNAYLDVATSYKVCQRAALIIGRSDILAEDIQGALNVTSSLKENASFNVTNFINSSATIISFAATTEDPEISRLIADAAAESYAIEMASILKSESVKPLDSASIGVISENAFWEAWKTRIKFAILGFLLALMFVVGCEIFDRKVCTIREATIKDKLPVIGIIPDYKE